MLTSICNRLYHERECDENCPDALKCGLGEFVDPKLLSFSKMEEILYDVSRLKFETFEDLEEFMLKNFCFLNGAELADENELGFLICDGRLLIVFRYENGAWKFDRLEKTAYADQC